jgi:hypothetical protein
MHTLGFARCGHTLVGSCSCGYWSGEQTFSHQCRLGVKILLIKLAFVFSIFLVRHKIDVVSYCALASRRPLGNRATIIITLE